MARLRTEIDSLPESLDALERQIRQLEIEREALKREQNETKLSKLKEQLDSNLVEDRAALRLRWQQEKKLIGEIREAKESIEALRIKEEVFERQGRYDEVARIRHGRIPALKRKIVDVNQQAFRSAIGWSVIEGRGRQ